MFFFEVMKAHIHAAPEMDMKGSILRFMAEVIRRQKEFQQGISCDLKMTIIFSVHLISLFTYFHVRFPSCGIRKYLRI
jgi:hypothetical protein